MKFSSFSNTVRTIFVKFSTVILHPKAFEKRRHFSLWLFDVVGVVVAVDGAEGLHGECVEVRGLLGTPVRDYQPVRAAGAQCIHHSPQIRAVQSLHPLRHCSPTGNNINNKIIKDLLLLLIKGSTLIENKTYD